VRIDPPFRDASHVVSQVERTHERVGIIPGSDPSLRYLLPVPRGWGRVWGMDATPGPGRPEILGAFAPDPDLGGPRLLVSVSRLRWDVDPVLWVCHGWQNAGWQVAVAGLLEPRWHPRFEVGAVRQVAGEIEVRRTVGFLDNGRLVRVDTAAPARSWRKHHDLLWPCGVLMALAQPTYRREVERTERYESPSLSFELPASWTARLKPPPWPGALRWAVRPVEGAEGAVAMRIDATPWPSGRVDPIQVRHDRVRRELWAEQIAMARRVERISAGYAEGSPGLGGFFRTDARDHEEDFEVRFAHRDVFGWSVDLTAVIASPARCALDRMRAARAMEIAVATARIEPKERTSHAA
jgi:hypothetical protein